MSDRAHEQFTDVILQRVCGEFLEMPGLRLTPRQAQRLWGLDEETCVQLLEHLVDVNFLRRSDHGLYCRGTDGPSPFPRPRMLKAQLEPARPAGRKAVGT